jgi:hypothetical protein
MQFLIIYFSLQVKNKPHAGVANCMFILELGMVMNICLIRLTHMWQVLRPRAEEEVGIVQIKRLGWQENKAG